MKLYAVCIRDSAAVAYSAPLFFPALGMAERWFKDECNSSQSELAKHPSDYELHLVGGFDTEGGELLPETPRLIARGQDMRPVLS